MVEVRSPGGVRLLGVDGCRGGWLAADDHGGLRLCRDFAEVLAGEAPGTRVAVDMPLGLPDEPGSRECDRLARRLLGRRACSVFNPPARRHLGARNFSEVSGLSLQGFHLLAKIRELDGWITPELQESCAEAHPELAFLRLAGRPLPPKRSPEGREARLALVPEARAHLEARRWPRRLVAPDDILDAFALVRTARRMAEGTALVLPDPPPRDARGLRMEIRY